MPPLIDGDYLVSLPYLALSAAMAVMLASAILLIVARYFDPQGTLVIAIVVVVAFVTATFASMIYKIQQTPMTELLLGGLAAGLGLAIGRYLGGPRD